MNTRKGPGFARQCGLNHARGEVSSLHRRRYTLSAPVHQYHDKGLTGQRSAGAYALWSFLPNEHHLGLFFYETLRDLYLKIQNLNRPELNVRGMAFAFHTETARKEGFRTDILRGEDGSLALALKKYGKLRFVTARKARVLTGYGTISADGSLFSSFKKRAIKGLRSFTALFYSKNNYEDEDSNLIK